VLERLRALLIELASEEVRAAVLAVQERPI